MEKGGNKLIRSFHPFIFILMETHCLFKSIAGFCNSLGYEICHLVEANGHARGIWVLAEKK